MNAQERDQLQQFLATLRQQRAQAKDPVADALIREALSAQGDATYLLVQRAMALSLALQATQKRLAQWQAASAPAQPWPPVDSPNAVASASPPEVRASAPIGGAGTAPPSLWLRGLVGQVGGTALGVATGVVAGGALLQGLHALWGADDASPAAVLGGSPNDSLSASSSAGDAALWDLGEDWA